MKMFLVFIFDNSGESEAFEIPNMIKSLRGFMVPLIIFLITIFKLKAIVIAFRSCDVRSVHIFLMEKILKYDIPQKNVSIVDPNKQINGESSETKQTGRRFYEAVCSDGCNGVSISAFAEPSSVYRCHCQECRDGNSGKPVTWIAFSQKDVVSSGPVLSYENKRFLCSRCLTKIYMVYERGSEIYINRDRFKNMAFRDAHIESLRLSIPKFEAAHICLGTKTCSGAKYLDTGEGKRNAELQIKPKSWKTYTGFSK